MVISFCGHADYLEEAWHEELLLSVFEEVIGQKSAELLLGDYGAFDRFALRCGGKYKRAHSNVTLAFVTPYCSDDYCKRRIEYSKNTYDAILYPGLENVPPRYAISRRNRYMMEAADTVIAYVKRPYGGAYSAYRYAIGRGKRIINLALRPKP